MLAVRDRAVMLRLLAEALRTPVLLAAVCALHLAMVAAVVTSASLAGLLLVALQAMRSCAVVLVAMLPAGVRCC